MRPQRRRTKKLIVAFHFSRSNQAGWKCDTCRKAGLEGKRRCGWRPEAYEGDGPVVWARDRVALTTCPRSYVSAQSMAWLESFETRRRLAIPASEEMPARDADAFLVLAAELAAERANG